MPRIAPTLYEFVELDERRLPEGRRGLLADLRPPGVAAGEPRPRPDQGADRQDRHRRLPRDGRGGARGRLGRRARLRRRAPQARSTTRRRTRRRRPARYGSPNGDRSEFDALPAGERQAAAPGGVQRGRGQGDPRRPDPRAAPRPRPRSCATSAAATPAPPCSRTWSCAGCATSRSTTSGSGSASSASATPAPHEITDVVSCPGTDSCKLGITSSMGLNQAVQERLEAMQITDPLTKRDPHQDDRLPERLRPAPHRQHRLLRRLAQGRRAPRSRPTSPTSAATTRAARSSTATG